MLEKTLFYKNSAYKAFGKKKKNFLLCKSNVSKTGIPQYKSTLDCGSSILGL